MTRFEYIKSLDQMQLAHFLCYRFKECNTCPVKHKCGVGTSKQNGWLAFLEHEVTQHETIEIKQI